MAKKSKILDIDVNSDINKEPPRTNCWAFCMYPGDSMPDNYLSILDSLVLPIVISPVHDADMNAPSYEKKCHIHVMIYFGEGKKKSFDQVYEISKLVGGCMPIYVENANAMVRYFLHTDNPEKSQRSKGMTRNWNVDDLTVLHGFEIHSAFLTYTKESEIYRFVEDVIKKECIFNSVDLQIYLAAHNYEFELMFVRKHITYFIHFLNGMWQKMRYSK